MIEGVHVSDDELMMYFAPGRLAFRAEGAGKTRNFAIPNAVKQALLRPAHDWCMSVLRLIPMDGTFDQVLLLPKPQMRKRRGRKSVPVEPAQLKHKKSALEEYIDSLDE